MKLYTPSFATPMHPNNHKQAADDYPEMLPRECYEPTAPNVLDYASYYEGGAGDSWFGAQTPGGTQVVVRDYDQNAMSGVSTGPSSAIIPRPHMPAMNLLGSSFPKLSSIPPCYAGPFRDIQNVEYNRQMLEQGQNPYGWVYDGAESTPQWPMNYGSIATVHSPIFSEPSDDESMNSPSPPAEVDDTAQHRPYAQLIYEALLSKDDKQMVLNEIYDYFRARWPKFKNSKSKGWMNSIRHNLSMNGAFEKIDRPEGDQGKGFIWRLTESAITSGVKSTTRYRKQGSNASKKRARSPADDDSNKRVRRESARLSIAANAASASSRDRRRSSTTSMAGSLSNSAGVTYSNGAVVSEPLYVPTSLEQSALQQPEPEQYFLPAKSEGSHLFDNVYASSKPDHSPSPFSGSYFAPTYQFAGGSYLMHTPSGMSMGAASLDGYGNADDHGDDATSNFRDQYEMLCSGDGTN